MKQEDIIIHRLVNQRIAFTAFTQPHEIVSHMGAMQAQEYAMAKWAIGLRLKGVNDADVEEAFNTGKILRTHLLRPTWHFVAPEDIRWMLALTAPTVNAVNAFMYRKTELDSTVFKHTHKVIEKTLQGGKFLTRTVLQSALEKAKIKADGVRLSCLMMEAELAGLICSGPRVGKQFTYALLEERVPVVKAISRDEALAKLSQQYFISRGPATVQDFAWWSGLNMKDAKHGFEMVRSNFVTEKAEGKDYIFKPDAHLNLNWKEAMGNKDFQSSFLMPDYDEYIMAYKDRGAIFDAAQHKEQVSRGNPVFNRMIIHEGRIKGTWQKGIKNKSLSLELFPFRGLNKKENRAVQMAVKRYSDFAGGTQVIDEE